MDPLSLTLTIGPLLVKAAKLAKLCQEVQTKIKSAPLTLASIITECSGVNHVLVEVQNLGLRDLSFLDADLRKRFGDEIDSLAVGCTSVLSTIEQHVGEFQDVEGTVVGPLRRMGLKDKIKVVWKEDDIQMLLQTLRGYQLTLGTSLNILHMQIDLNTHRLAEMQGTVLTTLLQRSREQARHPRRPNTDQESENVSSRFSVLSTSSDITDTSFTFDQEALNSSIYRQAFKQRIRNLVSLPQKFRGDKASVHAVSSLREGASYYEEAIEASEETAIFGSAEAVVAVDDPADPATQEDSTLQTEGHLSYGTEITEDRVSPSNQASNNAESDQGIVDPSLTTSNTLEQKENLVPAQPEKANEPSKPSRWAKLLRNPAEQTPSKPSGALVSRTSKPSTLASASSEVQLDPRSLYFASATKTIKLVAVGESGPAKTRLLITYTTQKYPSEYTPTVFDNYAVTVMLGTEKWTLGCFDTAGQEDYNRLRPLSYPQTDVFLICANRAHLDEYESVKKKWIPELNRYVPQIPKLLVGVKDPEDEISIDRTKYGTKLAKDVGAEKYLQCDLMDIRSVSDVFDEAIAMALARVLTKEELRREKEKEKKVRQQAAASAPRKPMEGIKEDPPEILDIDRQVSN